ncbi:FkbM family methyltransferase [Phycicoccus flavus]|uniref:Methyltransferase FkbM domain-containing protein n=1 Tax=Phycicoccus flavus TaxID=2502783 RepID=A0A8T6R5A4_9MICO|nr:FkbM family methyltransferase [Phycicoccus flavus]NHA69157.1 hypothetical protein [Phycicoccus flavus]
MRRYVRAVRHAVQQAGAPDRTDEVLAAVGHLETSLLSLRNPGSLNEAEFKVFSQFGEDGAIQYLLHHVQVPETTFVEIGVESYRESNTRFLAVNDNWRGLAVDGSEDHVRFIAESDLGWRADVRAVQRFVTRENIDALLEEHGFTGDIGLLSIDVDGMDYWLFEAVTVARPAVLVMEFNPLFGPDRRLTVPYSPDFVYSQAHWSRQYYGASLAALESLAATKGYVLAGVSNHVVNAFFVRADLATGLSTTTSAEAWRPSRVLSSRAEDGSLQPVADIRQRLAPIAHLPLLDLESGQEVRVGVLLDR